MIQSALVVSTRWKQRANHLAFGDTLAKARVAVQHVPTIEDALALLSLPGLEVECVLLDADSTDGGHSVELMTSTIKRLRAEAPAVAPVVVATLPSTRLVTAAFRAGAADVIDLATSDEPAVLDALALAASDHRTRASRATRVGELRQLIDDFLRVLVKAERRTLELEAELNPGEESADDSPPHILVVDDEASIVDLLTDVLTREGLMVHGSYTGEDALRFYERLTANHRGVDLAIVDKNLPGISGLDTIRQLRAMNPGLPCMLITGFSTGEAALRAADLGVVGYVLKPFDDVRQLAARVKQLAARAAAERRERRYLARIKQKHAQFLERYRQIVADLDHLKS